MEDGIGAREAARFPGRRCRPSFIVLTPAPSSHLTNFVDLNLTVAMLTEPFQLFIGRHENIRNEGCPLPSVYRG